MALKWPTDAGWSCDNNI